MENDGSRILVLEDNDLLAKVLEYNLVRAGFAVTVVHNCQDAIKQLETHTFDLVVSDYQLPDGDSVIMLRHVRATLQLRDLPILLCSGRGLELDAEQLCAEWNVATVLHKPFSVREVVALARKLCVSRTVAN